MRIIDRLVSRMNNGFLTWKIFQKSLLSPVHRNENIENLFYKMLNMFFIIHLNVVDCVIRIELVAKSYMPHTMRKYVKFSNNHLT